MENSSSSPGKNELVESMFKSLNSYTNELQQGSLISSISIDKYPHLICSSFHLEELELVNRKMADQIRIGQLYDTSQEERRITSSIAWKSFSSLHSVQNDLIKLRAAIETNTGMISSSINLTFFFSSSVKRSIFDRNLIERTTLSQS